MNQLRVLLDVKFRVGSHNQLNIVTTGISILKSQKMGVGVGRGEKSTTAPQLSQESTLEPSSSVSNF